MNAVIVLQVINILLTVYFGFVLYSWVRTDTPITPRTQSTQKSSLRPFSKIEKRKPKANDDEMAWKKENNIE